MVVSVSQVPLELGHIVGFGSRCRSVERLECELVTGLSVEDYLVSLVNDGIGATTTIVDGRVEGFHGFVRQVSASDGLYGHCLRYWGWVLSTDFAFRSVGCGRVFMALSKKVIDSLPMGLYTIENWCLCENRASVRWLGALGFVFDPVVYRFRGRRWRRFMLYVDRCLPDSGVVGASVYELPRGYDDGRIGIKRIE